MALTIVKGRAILDPIRWRLWTAILLALAAAPLASGQARLTLEQAGSRSGPDFVPAFEDREAIVNGQVSTKPLCVMGSYYLPLQDADEYGLLLHGAAAQFQGLAPGDWVEARGRIVKRGGMPMLIPAEIRRLRAGPAPAPKRLRIADVASFRYLGVLVTVESAVAQVGENSGGDLVSIGEKGGYIHVFLPKTRRDSGPGLNGFRSGDKMRAAGIAAQNCTLPPYDRFYQILLPDAASAALVEKAWLVPPPMLLLGLSGIGALLGIWWIRERRMAGLRRRMRVLNSLGEEVIASASPMEILRKLADALPKLTRQAGVSLYLYNRGVKALENVRAPAGGGPVSIRIEAPGTPLESGLALCFRNRTLIAIADTRRSPLFKNGDRQDLPRAIMLVPMFAQNELLGVLQLEHAGRVHFYSPEEQAGMQHLANQVATALKLQEQQSIREQLFRSEKLAAAGQLISGVANELRNPLEAIVNQASALSERAVDGCEMELQSIAAEAARASEIVARLVSFGKVEKAEAQPVDVNERLAGLLHFRAREMKQKGIEVREQLAARPLIVIGSPGQLEQVFLNLLVDAEQAMAQAREKILTISSGALARRVLIEISYQTRASEFQKMEPIDDPSASGSLGIGVCRGIVQSHGGDFRAVRVSPAQARFEIELPLAEAKPASGAAPAGRAQSRRLTVLVVEPDVRVQRRLVQMLSNRGDRVVPVASAEEGGDLTLRLRFDLALCAMRLPGLSWLEFFERVRRQVGGFVLLTEGFDADLARVFQGGDGFVLSKPVDEAELQRICRLTEERAVATGA